MKEYYKKFKEFRADPKKKSLSLLIIYLIFFIFVFIYINSHNQVNEELENNNQKDNVEINGEIVNSYEYSYDITINNQVINIDGIYYEDKQTFNFDNTDYYIKDNKIYLDNDNSQENLDYPLNKLNYNDISNFLSNYEYESKTEYKDNKIKYEYIIDNQEIAKYFNQEITNNGNTSVIIYENNYIYQVDIDLSNYYNVDKYTITINYNNINSITNLDINTSN